MYWITENLSAGIAEREDQTFVAAFCVFSSQAAAADLRYTPGTSKGTREVSRDQLADILESLSIAVVKQLIVLQSVGHGGNLNGET